MTLKDYIVVKTPESEFEVWTRKTYENYINGAVSVGAGSAYKLITTFNADEQLQDQKGLRWVKASERLPEIVNKKAMLRYVKVERQKYDKSGTWLQKQTAYYFPDRFKSVEWEDWDDYSQEDFPYTEEDADKGVVWLRAGWYASIDCDKCEGYWSAPLNVIEWLDENPHPGT